MTLTTANLISRLLDGFEQRFNAREHFTSSAGDFTLRVIVAYGRGRFGFSLTRSDDVALAYSEYPLMQTAEARGLIRQELERVVA